MEQNGALTPLVVKQNAPAQKTAGHSGAASFEEQRGLTLGCRLLPLSQLYSLAWGYVAGGGVGARDREGRGFSEFITPPIRAAVVVNQQWNLSLR